LHPPAALPEASRKDHGEGRPETDTLTVSSNTTARNQNPTIPSTLNYNDADQLSRAHAEGRRTPPDMRVRIRRFVRPLG
jgi:hypothetical protein